MTETKRFKVGQRVRIHPASDWFARGAKYGTITSLPRWERYSEPVKTIPNASVLMKRRPKWAYVKLENIGPLKLRVKLSFDLMEVVK